MAAAAGLFNHTAAQSMAGGRVSSMDSATDGTNDTSTSSTDSSTISSNDFLTLLVTELQNQDPTASTDPNEYVNQLVAVNSLEQLISINQTLSGALGTTSSDSAQAYSSTSSPLTPQTSNSNVSPTSEYTTPASAQSVNSIANRLAPGNLSVPQTNAAAERVAHALDGQSNTKSAAGLVPAGR